MKSTKTEARWRALICEQERSGLSVRQFSENKGVSIWSMYKWRRRLGLCRRRRELEIEGRRGGEPGVEAELVAVEVVHGDRESSRDDGESFRIEFGRDLRLVVHLGFNERELSRLISVLRSSC